MPDTTKRTAEEVLKELRAFIAEEQQQSWISAAGYRSGSDESKFWDLRGHTFKEVLRKLNELEAQK